jgi:hypothetical protein
VRPINSILEEFLKTGDFGEKLLKSS